MSKKIRKKILLALFLLILVLAIILIVNATKEYIQIKSLNDVAIAEANQEEREEELAYKAQWAEEHANTISQNASYSTSYETDEVLENLKTEAESKSNRQNDIIKKYYPDEYERICNDIENYYNSSFVIDLNNPSLLESESKLYDLVLNILENEDLSDEEYAVLKEYINDHIYSIQENENLKTRADKILE